jgi:hypothetical protein
VVSTFQHVLGVEDLRTWDRLGKLVQRPFQGHDFCASDTPGLIDKTSILSSKMVLRWSLEMQPTMLSIAKSMKWWLLALGSWLIAMVRISTAQRCGNAFFGAKDVSGFQRLVLRDGCDQSGRHLAQLVLAVPSTGKPRNQE